MPVRDKDEGSGAGDATSAVERSLDDFIARANTTLPPPGPGKKGTLVVLGPQAPLAEVTEIVHRLPTGERPSRRSLALVGFGLAFAAGAVAVLIATRFISGTPSPVAPAVVEPTPPRPVVVPMPVPTPTVEPVAAPATVPDPVPAPDPVPVPAPRRATRVAAKPRPAPAAAAPEKPKKPATGLVDPFAN